ncbi:B-block binding subunit of TFIIIC [Quillaja saponaria]|uniref:B-block binding subunit of TFIIIC n=1 Tax=Quillaja saponaria TaxID=32244 RepID=A0AAD7LRZ6_QUISA|nr:B-block binding subunit of TFIIIC [Quillaja saponaria]
MTAEQHAELLKCVVKDDISEKLSPKECEIIAKDLNLTPEQVLRVYYDQRQQRLDRCQIKWNECHPLGSNHGSSGWRRNRSSEARSVKHPRIDTATEQLDEQRLDIGEHPNTVLLVLQESLTLILQHFGMMAIPQSRTRKQVKKRSLIPLFPNAFFLK